MSQSDKSESYENGWNTHKNGTPVSANPYIRGTQARSHYQWEEGWYDRFNMVDRHGQYLLMDEQFNPNR